MRALLMRNGRWHATYVLDSEALRAMVWTTAGLGWHWVGEY